MSKFKITLASGKSFVADNVTQSIDTFNGIKTDALSMTFFNRDENKYDVKELDTEFSTATNLISISVEKESEKAYTSDGQSLSVDVPPVIILDKSAEYQELRNIYKDCGSGSISVSLVKSTEATENAQLKAQMVTLTQMVASLIKESL